MLGSLEKISWLVFFKWRWKSFSFCTEQLQHGVLLNVSVVCVVVHPSVCPSDGGSLKGHGSYNMFNPQWKPMLHLQLQEVQWSPAGQRSDSSSRQAWLARCISYFHTVTIWMPILTNKRHFFYLLENLKERYFKSGFTRISETLSYFNNIE